MAQEYNKNERYNLARLNQLLREEKEAHAKTKSEYGAQTIKYSQALEENRRLKHVLKQIQENLEDFYE
jgi:hypothetical protein